MKYLLWVALVAGCGSPLPENLGEMPVLGQASECRDAIDYWVSHGTACGWEFDQGLMDRTRANCATAVSTGPMDISECLRAIDQVPCASDAPGTTWRDPAECRHLWQHAGEK